MSSTRHARTFAWLAVLALLVRVLLPVLCHLVPSSAPVLDEASAGFVMCAAHDGQAADGIKPGPAPPPYGKPASDRPSPTQSPSDHCPACALAKVLVLLVLAGLAVLAALSAPRPARRWCRAAADLLPDHLRSGTVRSRAPPLPA